MKPKKKNVEEKFPSTETFTFSKREMEMVRVREMNKRSTNIVKREDLCGILLACGGQACGVHNINLPTRHGTKNKPHSVQPQKGCTTHIHEPKLEPLSYISSPPPPIYICCHCFLFFSSKTIIIILYKCHFQFHPLTDLHCPGWVPCLPMKRGP